MCTHGKELKLPVSIYGTHGSQSVNKNDIFVVNFKTAKLVQTSKLFKLCYIGKINESWFFENLHISELLMKSYLFVLEVYRLKSLRVFFDIYRIFNLC